MNNKKRTDSNGNKDFVNTNLGMILLKNIIVNRGMHGYDEILEIRSQYGVLTGPSSIYPALKKLETKGAISSSWDMTGKKPKRVYTPTEAGLEMYKEYQSHLNTMNLPTRVEIGIIPTYQLEASSKKSITR